MKLAFIITFLLLVLPTTAYSQNVVVIGDSLAHPIAVQLQFLHPSITVHRNSLGGTGLVYNYQTWLSQFNSFLRRNNPSTTFIVLGTNDANNISPSIPFNSTSWNQTYSNRVRTIVYIALQYSHKVVWIGSPPMRNQNFSNKIQHLNFIVQQTINSLHNPNVTFFDCFNLFNNTFNLSYRESDGIHLTHRGARFLANHLSL